MHAADSSHEVRARECAPNINVTPFIDILLVLLIIFMVITPLKPHSFKTLVPEKSNEIDERMLVSLRTLTVEVASDRAVRLRKGFEIVAEGSVEDAAGISVWLAREWAERKARGDWRAELSMRSDLAPDERIERTVFVKAPRSIRYGEVAKVIDALKGAGANPVGLQTEALAN